LQKPQKVVQQEDSASIIGQGGGKKELGSRARQRVTPPGTTKSWLVTCNDPDPKPKNTVRKTKYPVEGSVR